MKLNSYYGKNLNSKISISNRIITSIEKFSDIIMNNEIMQVKESEILETFDL